MTNMKLRTYLEYQADRIEATLAAHRTPARVIGGTVGPRLIRFFLTPAPHVRFASIKSLDNDLAIALRTQKLAITRGNEGVVLEFPNPEPCPVELRSLLAECRPLPAGTAVLGLDADGVPLLARLPSPEVAHILISGTTGSGKSVLLRTIATGLMQANASTHLGIIAIDPKARTFPKHFTAPHFLRPIITAGDEATETLRSLTHLMETRDAHGESRPLVVTLIDELADLVMNAQGVERQLSRVLQRGREAGIHVVAATQRPSAAVLSGIMRANFPLRLVGRVVSPEDARVAAGRGGSNAHQLSGRGDFLAITGEGNIRFQAAHITHTELQQTFPAVETAPLFNLPVAPNPETADAQIDDIDILTARLRPWWRKHGQQYGAKSKAIQHLWGSVPAGGWHWKTLNRILERLQA